MINSMLSSTVNISCSDNTLLKISAYFGVSHEEAYRKGADSLLKLTEVVLAGNEHSDSIKLFLCDCHLRKNLELDEIINTIPMPLLGDCLNVIILRYAFKAKLGDFLSGGDTLINSWKTCL